MKRSTSSTRAPASDARDASRAGRASAEASAPEARARKATAAEADAPEAPIAPDAAGGPSAASEPVGADRAGAEPAATATLDALLDALLELRTQMLAHEQTLRPWIAAADPAWRASATNLAHYLAMRRFDLRTLQRRLARLGLSSLGRSEGAVLAQLDTVIGVLGRLVGRTAAVAPSPASVDARQGAALLAGHTTALLGKHPPERAVRIMVTLPSQAATDEALVASLVRAGMDVARINCAHDTAEQWAAMARLVRACAKRQGRKVRVLMDLGGPKLRTGAIEAAPGVLKLRPERDDHGRVTAPGLLALRAPGAQAAPEGAAAAGVSAAFFDALLAGMRVALTDARGARRRLTVIERHTDWALLATKRTAYLTADTELTLVLPGKRAAKRDARHLAKHPDTHHATHPATHHAAPSHDRHAGAVSTRLADLPQSAGRLLLARGDTLELVADGLGRPAIAARGKTPAQPARIACTLPAALAQARKGDRVWFDDGRIGAVVRRKRRHALELEITHARDGGEKLAADRGINLPDTPLDLPALPAKDLDDLDVIARQADLVGLSFCQSAADVALLDARLAELDARHLGIVLKIETRRGFDHLPEILLAAMRRPGAGVMIARGDLAVECGYERLAEVQEQMLWACEAAHMPVVWATQVLETLAKTGLPSRAEITDAAMGERAECVMLNKGPYIVDAMRTLDDILQRMQGHQTKKRSLLRELKTWRSSPAAEPPQAPEAA